MSKYRFSVLIASTNKNIKFEGFNWYVSNNNETTFYWTSDEYIIIPINRIIYIEKNKLL